MSSPFISVLKINSNEIHRYGHDQLLYCYETSESSQSEFQKAFTMLQHDEQVSNPSSSFNGFTGSQHGHPPEM